MIRQILNVTWGVAIGIAVTTFILSVGSTLPHLTLKLAIVSGVAGAIVVIGLVVFEIENRAFKRGQLDAEERIMNLKEVKLP